VKKYDPDLAAGIIEEEELEAIVSGDAQGAGWSAVTTAISTIVTAITGVTLNATPCPTSACTKRC
jgi:hypothetical protein